MDNDSKGDLYAAERKELSLRERLLVDFLLFLLITLVGLFIFLSYHFNLINNNTDVTVDLFVPVFIIGIVLFLYSVNLIISLRNFLNLSKEGDA
jgi:tellurite resistance protein TehA-like permease